MGEIDDAEMDTLVVSEELKQKFQPILEAMRTPAGTIDVHAGRGTSAAGVSAFERGRIARVGTGCDAASCRRVPTRRDGIGP